MSALCQKRTRALQHKTWLFDHLVGGGDQCWWDRQSERLSSFAVNDQLKSCRRLHWKIGRFFSFEDTVDVVRCWPEVTSDVDAIGGRLPSGVHRRAWIEPHRIGSGQQRTHQGTGRPTPRFLKGRPAVVVASGPAVPVAPTNRGYSTRRRPAPRWAVTVNERVTARRFPRRPDPSKC